MSKVGNTQGFLTVLRKVGDYLQPSGKSRPIYECICECGNIVTVRSNSMHNRSSCGCLKLQVKEPKQRSLVTKHNSRYHHMLARCYDENAVGYSNYGGRGISVCERWRGTDGLVNFCEDMGECPKDFTLDRIDVNGDYSPDNYRWADHTTQSYNRRKDSNNTSGRTGVYWFKRVNKWTAAIHFQDNQIHLGYFNKYEDAVAVRRAAEVKYYGVTKDYGE